MARFALRSHVHDPNASQVLETKPAERVRIFFVNANINMPVALHRIGGIRDRVYINGSEEHPVPASCSSPKRIRRRGTANLSCIKE